MAQELLTTGRFDTHLAQPSHESIAGRHDPAGCDDGQNQFGARQRRRPQNQAHVRAQTPAGDQDHALDIVGVLVDELHGDTTTE